MKFFEAVASQRNAWWTTGGVWMLTLLFAGAFIVCARNQAPDWTFPVFLWGSYVLAAAAFLALLHSLLPSPIHWVRTLLALMLLGMWCGLEWFWYVISHAPLTKLW